MPRFTLASILVIGFLAAPSHADMPCPAQCSATATFANTFSDNYRPGEPYDVVSILPDGSGETLASVGITIEIYIRNCNGTPVAGVAAQEIVMFSPSLCICPLGNIADAPTDQQGRTTFTGTLRAGGCADNVSFYEDGVWFATLPLKFNSADAVPASPCAVDAGDLSAIAAKLGSEVGEAPYSICLDLNEDGYIDASDISSVASALGNRCR